MLFLLVVWLNFRLKTRTSFSFFSGCALNKENFPVKKKDHHVNRENNKTEKMSNPNNLNAGMRCIKFIIFVISFMFGVSTEKMNENYLQSSFFKLH